MLERGYFSIGVFHSKNVFNIGTLWRSAHCFGADYIFTIGRRYDRQCSDTMKTERHIPLFNFIDLDDFKRHLPKGCELVGIEIVDKAWPLQNFRHPERACYLLGAEDTGLSDNAISACHRIVYIPGAFRCLNVSVAGSIVMYDRVIKTTQKGDQP